MKKLWYAIVVVSLLLSFSFTQKGWKELDLNAFKITVPDEWQYHKENGIDSFAGEIESPQVNLSFDCSASGYANHLLPTEDEYLKSNKWLRDCPLYKPGVTYTANFNVQKEKARQMKEKGITDSTLVKVEGDPCFNARKIIHKPTAKEKVKYPEADYIAELAYKGETTYVPIQIPSPIKSHNIKLDTTNKYIIKTIWPKVAGAGITGIYIKSRSSSFNFMMAGKNLSEKDQVLALHAFRTIRFKDN